MACPQKMPWMINVSPSSETCTYLQNWGPLAPVPPSQVATGLHIKRNLARISQTAKLAVFHCFCSSYWWVLVPVVERGHCCCSGHVPSSCEQRPRRPLKLLHWIARGLEIVSRGFFFLNVILLHLLFFQGMHNPFDSFLIPWWVCALYVKHY